MESIVIGVRKDFQVSMKIMTEIYTIDRKETGYIARRGGWKLPWGSKPGYKTLIGLCRTLKTQNVQGIANIYYKVKIIRGSGWLKK